MILIGGLRNSSKSLKITTGGIFYLSIYLFFFNAPNTCLGTILISEGAP